ncbi:MAG: hypothetical protein ACLPH3_22030 [Terracidiphilus sp.]
MESRKFVAYNQTRETLLSSSVSTVNAGLEPLKVLKVLIEGLPANSRTGLWLTNFKGVPVARTLSPFDLVYLDKDNRVVHGVELSKDGEFAPFRGQPASALVLPSRSLSASKTREGDQLDLRVAEPETQPEAPPVAKPEPQLEHPPASVAAPQAPVEAASIPQIEQVPAELTPSARFFSPAETAPPPRVSEFSAEPFAAAEDQSAGLQAPLAAQQASATNPFPEASAAKDAVLPAEPSPVESVEFFPVRKPRESPFWPERTPLESPRVPQSPAPPPEPLATVEPLSSMAGVPVLPAPVQEPPATVPHHGDYGPAPKQKFSWKVRMLRWLFPELVIAEAARPVDRRRADRQSLSGLVAYYFTGGSPAPQRIGNISVTGFYLHTDERWMPGTVVRMTLQRVGSKGDDPSDTITVNSKIVRWGADGEGFEFILTDLED